MKRMRIPNTDLEVSRLAYGCMQIGGRWDRTPYTAEDVARVERLVQTALEQGLNFFDHADIGIDRPILLSFLLNGQALFHARLQVMGQLRVELVARVHHQAGVDIPPVRLQVGIHARKGTFHCKLDWNSEVSRGLISPHQLYLPDYRLPIFTLSRIRAVAWDLLST